MATEIPDTQLRNETVLCRAGGGVRADFSGSEAELESLGLV